METIRFEEIAKVREAAGQSAERIAQKAQEFTRIPKTFIGASIGFKTFKIKGIEHNAVGLYSSDKKHFIGENTLFANTITDELHQVNPEGESKNKGKYMLKSENINPELMLEESADKNLFNLIGKTLISEPTMGFTLRLFTPEAMFTVGNTTADKKALKDNRIPKKMFKFAVQ